MDVLNRGQQQLLKLTAKYGEGKRCAERCDVKLNQISQWCRGTRPDSTNRLKLRIGLGIPESWWDEPVESGRGSAA